MTESSSGALSTRQDGDVLIITMDDGKANALSPALLDDLGAALDAGEDAGSVVIAGRPGRFSAGFDLSVMQSGVDAARLLLRRGAEWGLRLYTYPRPVVLACTGHALAMGAIALMTADVRVGAAGDFKIGMNEVAIGMPVPGFAVAFARDRLAKDQFVPAVAHARIYDPEGAVGAGFLDRVVDADAVVPEAVAVAQELAGRLRRRAFEVTRGIARQPLADEIAAGLDDDAALFEIFE